MQMIVKRASWLRLPPSQKCLEEAKVFYELIPSAGDFNTKFYVIVRFGDNLLVMIGHKISHESVSY